MPTISEQRPLSVDEAATYLGYRKSYLYRLVGLRKIAYSKPLNGRVLFLKTDLDDFIMAGRRPAASELSEQADRIVLKAARK